MLFRSALKDAESPALTWRDPRDGEEVRLRCSKRDSPDQRRVGVVFTSVWQKVYDAINSHESWHQDDGPRLGVDKVRGELFVTSKKDARVLLDLRRDGSVDINYSSFEHYGVDKAAADDFAATLVASAKSVA